MNKIEIKQKEITNFILIVVSAFILTFILEHFKGTSWAYFPSEGKLNTMNITTLLGEYIEINVSEKNIKFSFDDYGYYKPQIKYYHNIILYFKALISDIIIPISIICIYLLFKISKRFIVIKK